MINMADQKPEPGYNTRRTSITSRIKILLLAVALLFGGMAFFGFVTLPWMVHFFLFYESPLEPADVILLGGTGSGFDTVIDLYRRGYAENVLVTQTIPEEYQDMEEPVFPYHFIINKLKEAGIPKEDIFSLGKQGKNMLEEQRIFRDWFYALDMESYIRFTGYEKSRYTKMIHDHTFPHGKVKAIIRTYESRHILRKQLLNMHNMLIRWLYWYFLYRPQIQAE